MDTCHVTPNLSTSNKPRIAIPKLHASVTKIFSSCKNNDLKANPGNSHTLLSDKKQKVFSTDRIPLTANSHEKLLGFR